ncbi:Vgb family protein [Nocardia testacea]|uniref:Vgb family protein n=1 Tax=Nocardia testacea TaxID=248551 RepID=UPI0033F61832
MLTRQRLAAGLIIGTTAGVAACSTSGPGPVVVDDGPKVAEGYRLERVVTGTALHSINGITIRPDGTLVATSLAGETITEIDPSTGAFTPLVGSPDGRSDDAVVTPTGELIWTDPAGGVVRRRETDGTISTVVDDLPGANPIAYDRARVRLFVGQTYLGSGLWEIDPTGASPKRLIAEDAGKPNAFACGPDATSALIGSIQVLDRTGHPLRQVAGFQQPGHAIEQDDGVLIVTEPSNGRLLRVDGAAAPRPIAEGLGTPTGLAVAGDGRILVTDASEGRVLAIDPEAGGVTVVGTDLGAPRRVAIARTGDRGSSHRHRAEQQLGDRRTAIRHAWREWALEGRNRRLSGACVVGQAR